MYEEIVREDIAAIAKKLGQDAKKLEGKTVFISGGAGFLGKYIIGTLCYLNDTLLSKPCRIISADNYITGQKHPHFNYQNRPEVIEVWADVIHPLPIREDINYIVHAAGLASPVYYKKYPLETIDAAVSGTKNLLELGLKNKNLEGFLFFSSSEIYGDPDPAAVPTPETYYGFVSSVGPRACYDESKRLGETLATIYYEKFNLPTKIVRPFNVFGPGMSHNDRRVLPMFTYMIINKQPIPVHGDGHQTRTFCYITDAIDGFFKVLLKGRPGEAYNIGSDENEISMRNLAELVTSIDGNGASYQLIPYPENYPAGEPTRRCPDISKAKEHLGFIPQTSLKEGLFRFMSWCRNDPHYNNGTIKI